MATASAPPAKRRRVAMASLGEILGDPARYGEPITMGAILPLLDMVAGRCAFMQSGGPVVTGCIDDVELLETLRHGDVVTADATVVVAGKSSLLLRVLASRDVLENGQRRKRIAARCYATFVAIDQESKTARKILDSAPVHLANGSIETSEAKSKANGRSGTVDLQAHYKANRRLFTTNDIATLSSMAETAGSFARIYSSTPAAQLPIDLTAIRIRKQFLPRHENFGGIVFGGDVLETLELMAVACANRMSGGAARFRSVGMRSLAFLRPVPPKNVLEIEAKVIATSERVVCVMVRSFLDSRHDGSDMVPCHHGVFHLVGVADDGVAHVSVGVRDISGRKDEYAADFYRSMALPMTKGVAAAWGLEDDAFPSDDVDRELDSHK